MPPPFGTPGRPRWNYTKIFGIRKPESLPGHMVRLCDTKFSHLCISPTCDKQTDRHRMTAHIALAKRCAVKILYVMILPEGHTE